MYTLAANISAAETDYGTVLLDEEHGKYWNLNPSGTLVLQSILRHGDPESAVSALMSEFDVDRSTVEKDVQGILDELLSSGILVLAAGDGAGRA